jgi:hypothetical protein
MQSGRENRAAARGDVLRRVLGVGLAASYLAACTKSPDSIDARYVSPTTYQAWSCEQLVDERMRLTREVDRVAGLQRENANADAALMGVGLIIFWPALIGLAATKDRKEELSRLKGEYEAVDSNVKGKQCSAPAPGRASAPVPTTPETAAAVAAAGGIYKGKGRTDAWCQTPTLELALKGNEFEGTFSELASGTPTSNVKGTLMNNGMVEFEFKGRNDNYFSGKVEGQLKADKLIVNFRIKAAAACTYQFDLPRS